MHPMAPSYARLICAGWKTYDDVPEHYYTDKEGVIHSLRDDTKTLVEQDCPDKLPQEPTQ